MSEGHQSGYERLKAQTTLQDILQVATEFERTARDFYRDLTPKVSKNIRYLVEELAAEEQLHYDMFTELMQNPMIEAQLMDSLQRPASDRQFSDAIHLPNLGDNPDDQAVLQYALGREHAAMEQYHALANEVPEGPAADLFRFLALEETHHKAELEKLYYETVHTGGV
ncbi:rubrerythrin [Ectothiorhodospiraceae bacterium BW-2]|nr:rubrerythrin [Ectothiorhodospiraceae bacterium BW-2]